MIRRLYRKVFRQLFCFFKAAWGYKPKGHKLARIRSLAAYITGMIREKSSHLLALGKGLLQLIKANSRLKAARKFVYNKAISYEEYYKPYMQEFVKMMLPLVAKKGMVYLVIDGSKIGAHYATLMISMVFGKRSLPICWIVKKGSKGHFTKANHIQVTELAQQYLSGVIPNDIQVALLGDGEFGTVDLQECCLDNNWNYVFRIKLSAHLYENENLLMPKNLSVNDLQNYEYLKTDQQYEIDHPIFDVLNKQVLSTDLAGIAPKDHCFLGQVAFTKKRFEGVNFVLWHDPKYQKPLPLLSNLEDARSIIEAYDKRYAVECLFKDLKSTSFNLEKTRLEDTTAIHNLIMIAAFAFTLLTKLAICYKDHPVRDYIYQARTDQVGCSFYNFALQLVGFFLKYELDFSFDHRVKPLTIEQIKKQAKAYALAA